MKDVPAPLLAKLRSLPGTRAEVHLILEEDLYETKFGDGLFLGLRGAFFDAAGAEACRDRLAKESAERLKAMNANIGSAFHLKTVVLVRDEMKNQITSDDEYSLPDIVRLLA